MTFFKKISIVSMFIAAGIFSSLCQTSAAENSESYVREACSVTQYNNICIHTLASFSNIAKKDPRKWARAGISVTIKDAKQVSEFLRTLKNRKLARRGRNRRAVLDCIELFEDTLDNLHRSLGVLRALSRRNFERQIEDVTTWISAALTDEDTCLDGFGSGNGGKQRWFKVLRNQVMNSSYLTSNALALVNKLGTTAKAGIHP